MLHDIERLQWITQSVLYKGYIIQYSLKGYHCQFTIGTDLSKLGYLYAQALEEGDDCDILNNIA